MNVSCEEVALRPLLQSRQLYVTIAPSSICSAIVVGEDSEAGTVYANKRRMGDLTQYGCGDSGC